MTTQQFWAILIPSVKIWIHVNPDFSVSGLQMVGRSEYGTIQQTISFGPFKYQTILDQSNTRQFWTNQILDKSSFRIIAVLT